MAWETQAALGHLCPSTAATHGHARPAKLLATTQQQNSVDPISVGLNMHYTY